MPRRHGIWYVTDPSGNRIQQPSRQAARAYVRSRGGSRAGYTTNEYAHRKEAVRQRIALGFTETAVSYLENIQSPTERTMGQTLLADWRLAYRAGDQEAASRFQGGIIVLNDYTTGGISPNDYEAYMSELYQFALDRGYVESDTTFKEWLYHVTR